MMARLTYDAVCIFLLKARQRWEDEAQGGNNNKHARHHCYHLRWRHDAADESMMMPMIMMPMMMMLRMMMMIMMMMMKIKGGGWWYRRKKKSWNFFQSMFWFKNAKGKQEKRLVCRSSNLTPEMTFICKWTGILHPLLEDYFYKFTLPCEKRILSTR